MSGTDRQTHGERERDRHAHEDRERDRQTHESREKGSQTLEERERENGNEHELWRIQQRAEQRIRATHRYNHIFSVIIEIKL